MKRSKRLLKEVRENLQPGVGLAAVVFVVCLARFSHWDLEEARSLAGSVFTGSLIFLSAAGLALGVYSRYMEGNLKLFMGYTRKEAFEDMQMSKFLGAAGVAVISAAAVLLAQWPSVHIQDLAIAFWGFVLMMLAQGLAELLTLISLRSRKQWAALAAIMTACAAIGGFIGYFVVAVMADKDSFMIRISFLFLQEAPLLWVLVFGTAGVLMGYVSWKLLKDLEVHL